MYTFRSLEAFPASSSTSAVRYSAAWLPYVREDLWTRVSSPEQLRRTGIHEELPCTGLAVGRTQDSGSVHSSCGTDTSIGGHTALQE